MKYTTKAFKAQILDIIRQFEKKYPKKSLQDEAKPYKKKLIECAEKCNTSILLYINIQQEIKKMPYWFSKVGYLVKDLREFLKINDQCECIDTDEHEKAELELSKQQDISPRPIVGQQELSKQLEKEEVKNELYLSTIDGLELEKRDLLLKLNAEVTNGLKYRQKIEELLSQRAQLTKEEQVDSADKITIEQLQQFICGLMEENTRLSVDLKDITANYAKALELNKKLQATYAVLVKQYKELKVQFNDQNRLFNNKLRLAQDETRQIRENFDVRITQLEQTQVGSFTNRKFHNRQLHKSSPINVQGKRNNKITSISDTRPVISCEKLSL